MNENMKKFFETIPKDEDIKKLRDIFSKVCVGNNCLGICSLTSPISEECHSSFYCDFLTGIFLIESIIRQFSEEFNAPIYELVSTISLGCLALEDEALDVKTAKINKKKYKLVLKKFKESLNEAFDKSFDSKFIN